MQRIYEPKALIDGSRLGKGPGVMFVGVPDKFGNNVIHVHFGGQRMNISSWKNEAKLFRRFRDKYWNESSKRPQYYTLGYFKWQPE
jgi:hypothetical protein